MKHKQQYKALLIQNSAANNLLVLNLLQSQEKWSKAKALNWIFQELIPDFENLQQERSFYFGNTGLSFIFHHAILKDSVFIAKYSTSNTEHLYKAVLICRIIKQKESKLLHKIDYIEDDSNLLDKYKQYLLEHLEQILCNFITEMD
jgi:hypothetical protein